MVRQRQNAGASAGVLAAIGMAAVGAIVALITGLGQGIGNATVLPDAVQVTSSVSVDAHPAGPLG